MNGGANVDPQLPPAPLAAEEEQVYERLSWVVVPLLIGMMLVVSAVSSAIHHPAYRARLASLPGGGPTPPSLWMYVLMSLPFAAWRAAQLGLGAALGDRWLPRRWSRAARWGVGMGIAGVVLHTYLVYTVYYLATGDLSGWLSAALSSPTRVWSVLSLPVTGMLAGFAFGWAAAADRGRGLKLVGAGACVWALTSLVSVGVAVLQNAQMVQNSPGLVSAYCWNLVSSVISGALVGLAFAAALSIGERRQLGRAAPRGTDG